MIYIYNHGDRDELKYFLNTNIKLYNNTFTKDDNILIFIELGAHKHFIN